MIGMCPKCRGKLAKKLISVNKKSITTVVCECCGYDLSSVQAPKIPVRRRRNK
jgi:uncharacterized protein (DUF983 family)